MIDFPQDDSDHVFLDRHLTKATLGADSFGQTRSQPVHVSVKVKVPRCTTADSKDAFSISYGEIARRIDRTIADHIWATVWEELSTLTSFLWTKILVDGDRPGLEVEYVRVEPLKHNAYGSVSYDRSLQRSRFTVIVRAACVIGVYDHERLAEQPQEVRLETFSHTDTDRATEVPAAEVYRFVRGSSFLTVEALAQSIVDTFQPKADGQMVRVTVSKPFAVPTAEQAGVVIVRRSQLPSSGAPS